MLNTFPLDVRSPNFNFSDELSGKAVLVADLASGYPDLNKLFTFDPREFIFELLVPEADKLKIMEFYENNKDVPFNWYNKQDNTSYEVVFISKPRCKIYKRKDLWRIILSLRQSSP